MSMGARLAVRGLITLAPGLALGLILWITAGRGHASIGELQVFGDTSDPIAVMVSADWDARLREAEALRDRGQLAEAIALYQALLGERPGDRAVREGLALTYAYSGDHNASIALYEELLADYPQDLGLQRQLAQVSSWQGNYNRAIALYESILAIAPDAVEVRLALAEVLSWDGQYEASIEIYDQVIAADPTNQSAWIARPQVVAWSGQTDRAIALYQEALTQYPGQPELLLGLARAYESQQRFAEAINTLQPLLDGQDPEAIALRDSIRAIETETGFMADGVSSQKSSFGIDQVVRFRIDDGPTRQSLRVGYTNFTQQSLEALGNTTLEFGVEGQVNALSLSGTAGVDVFSRLTATPRLGFQLSTPLSPTLTFTGNLRYGAYRENVATLENQVKVFHAEPTLYWQIDPQSGLFLSYKAGFYNDGNLEHQAIAFVDRQFGSFFASAFVFYWSFANDPQTGYFAPPNYLLYSGEIGWQGNLTEQLDCRLSASLERQNFDDTSEIVNTYRTACDLVISPSLAFNLGYQYSTNAFFSSGSTSSSQRLQGRMTLTF